MYFAHVTTLIRFQPPTKKKYLYPNRRLKKVPKRSATLTLKPLYNHLFYNSIMVKQYWSKSNIKKLFSEN